MEASNVSWQFGSAGCLRYRVRKSEALEKFIPYMAAKAVPPAGQVKNKKRKAVAASKRKGG
jgi:hypothetical protein